MDKNSDIKFVDDEDIIDDDDNDEIKSDDETIEVDTSSEKSLDDEDDEDDQEDEDEDDEGDEEEKEEDEEENKEDNDYEYNEDEVIEDDLNLDDNINDGLDDEYDTDSDDSDDDMIVTTDLNKIDKSFVHPLLDKTNLYDMKMKCEIVYEYDKSCECDIIKDENHMTTPILSKYERSRVLGLRTNQLNNGAEPFIEIEEDIIDGYKIAELELKAKKIPYIIQRPIPNGKCEFWRLEDLQQL